MTGARTRLAATWMFVGLLASVEARGDGGAVLVSETSGRFVITVFTAAQALQAGGADVSVLVQDRQSGAPILDADVTLHLTLPAAPPGTDASTGGAMTHAQATNQLLYATAIDLPVPGTWLLRVDVRHGTEAAELSAPLSVARGVPAMRTIWPYLLVPPAAVLLFGVHQSLARRRRQDAFGDR